MMDGKQSGWLARLSRLFSRRDSAADRWLRQQSGYDQSPTAIAKVQTAQQAATEKAARSERESQGFATFLETLASKPVN